jgi:hypothetical protein
MGPISLQGGSVAMPKRLPTSVSPLPILSSIVISKLQYDYVKGEMLRRNRFFVQSHLQGREAPRRKLAIFTQPSQIAQRDAMQDKGERAWGPLFFGPSVARARAGVLA